MKIDSGRNSSSDNNMADTVSAHARCEWTKSGGDVAGQRKLEERMLKLGLLENKKYFEQLLSEKLERSIAQRDVGGGGGGERGRPGRRRRPLRERANSMAQQMTNVIRAKVINDDDGRRVYTVNVLMGEFTQDVRHLTTGHVVVLSGSTPQGGGPKLSKDVTIEFPDGVDMDELSMAFVAGVYKLRVPFKYLRDSLPVTHALAAPTNDRTLSNGSTRSACRTLSGSSGYDTLSCVSTPSAPVDSDNDNEDEDEDEKVFQLNSDPENTQLQNGVTCNAPDYTASMDHNTTAAHNDTTSVDDMFVDNATSIDHVACVDDTAASVDDTAVNDDDTAAIVNDTAANIDDTAANVDDTAANVDDTAVHNTHS